VRWGAELIVGQVFGSGEAVFLLDDQLGGREPARPVIRQIRASRATEPLEGLPRPSWPEPVITVSGR
jgi:hypothetical protein